MTTNTQTFTVNNHPLAAHALLEASAGTGKTWTITRLVLRLLLDEDLDLSVRDILVVTYTNAATAELRDRIRKYLVEAYMLLQASLAPNEIEDELIRQLCTDKTAEKKLAMQNKLQRAIASFDEAAIFTIHAFCQRILDTCAFESGADFGLEIIQDETPIIQQIVLDEWRQQLYQGSPVWVGYIQAQTKLNTAEQWLKLLRPYAGHDYWRLADLAQEVSQEQLKQAETCLQERIQSLCFLWDKEGQAACSLLVGAIGVSLNGQSYKKDSAPQLIAHMQAWINQAQSSIWAAVSALRDKDSGFKTLQKWSAHYLEAKTNKGKTPPQHAVFVQVDEVLDAHQSLQGLYQAYFAVMLRDLWLKLNQQLPQYKQQRQQASFDDLLRQVYAALKADNPNQPELLRLLRHQFKAALIDEFQDTDPLQTTIFQTIFAPSKTPLFYVGDPKQAIYGFRGADVNAYLNVAQSFNTRYSLQTNRRSSPLLLSAINTLFGQSQAAFLEDAIDYLPVQAPVDAGSDLEDMQQPDCPPLQFLLLPPATQAPDATVKRQAWSLSASDAEQKSAHISAQEIARLLQQAAQGQLNIKGRALSGGDIAILVPSHRQATLMQSILQQYGIASVRKTEESVLHTDDAQHLYHLLCAIDNPAKLRILKGALLCPAFCVSLEAMQAWDQDPSQLNAWQTLFTQWRTLWHQQGFMFAFRSLLNAIGPDQARVPERLLSQADGERRLTNYMHLAEILDAQSAVNPSPSALLAWFRSQISKQERTENTLYSPQMRLESDADRVQIATIHSSKGLEYPIVFCPFLWRSAVYEAKQVVRVAEKSATGQWQTYLDFGSAQQVARIAQRMDEDYREQLRLLYVALTRPKYRCYVVWGGVEVPKSTEDKPKSGLHRAALTWLLHPPSQLDSQQAILPQLQAHCTTLSAESLQAQVQALVDKAPNAIALKVYEPQPNTPSPAQTQASYHPLQVPVFTRQLRAQWALSSFSYLSRGATAIPLPSTKAEDIVAPDHDGAGEQPMVQNKNTPMPPSVFNFPQREVPASVAGTCVHEVLERWDWQQPDTLEPIVQVALQKYGIQTHWLPVVMQMAQMAVQTPITPDGYALQAIPKQQRLAELGFMFPLRAITPKDLSACLQAAGADLPAEFIQAAQHLQFSTIGGYLNGFIDLIFCAPDGRYYLLDYKTNYLGDTLTDYTAQAMQHAMAHHHYYLQYLIYSIALHRHLQQRISSYAYDTHFGGAIYLFVRGLNGQNAHSGVYFHRPSLVLLQALETCLAG